MMYNWLTLFFRILLLQLHLTLTDLSNWLMIFLLLLLLLCLYLNILVDDDICISLDIRCFWVCLLFMFLFSPSFECAYSI